LHETKKNRRRSRCNHLTPLNDVAASIWLGIRDVAITIERGHALGKDTPPIRRLSGRQLVLTYIKASEAWVAG
jgi:hypothetical protein